MVSILGDYYYEFPTGWKLEKRLRDVLEKKVEEKYYLSNKQVKMFSDHAERKQAEGCGFKFDPTTGGGCAKCISTRAGSRTDDNFIIASGEDVRGIDGDCDDDNGAGL